MFRHMDEREIEIARIENVRMIHFYQLVAEGDALPAVAVYYGDNEQINLSVLDLYYERLLQKLTELYEASPDGIVMDESTERVLKAWQQQKGLAERKSEGGRLEPAFYPESYMDFLVTPVIRYYVKELYQLFSKPLTFRAFSGAWHGRGQLYGDCGDLPLQFPYRLRKVGEGEYHAFVGNFMNKTTQLTLHLVYEKRGFRIAMQSPVMALVGGSSFEVDPTTKRVVIKTSVSVENKVVYENTEEMNPLPPAEVEDVMTRVKEDGIRPAFPATTEHLIYYRLPWDQVMVLDVAEEKTDVLQTQSVNIFYLIITDQRDLLRQFSYRQVTGRESGVSLTTNLQAMEVYVKKSTRNLIQVFYNPAECGSTGDYQQRLAQRYYYYEGEMEQLL